MRAIYKNIYREIFRSPGRFLAILVIIILGSGFFVGLRVSKDGMILTAEKYLTEQTFFDFDIRSTLGVTADDADAFLALEGVADAEVSFEADALVTVGDAEDEYAFAIYSMPQRINMPCLLEGRYPESADECVVDSKAGLELTDTVRITDTNDDDTLDLFTGRELTVVGVCTAPLYLNYERGSTSVGSGGIAGFLYVEPELFDDVGYFTNLYLVMEDMPSPYSDEYSDMYDELEPKVTALAEERGDLRYSQIVEDADGELSDAQEEYDEALDEYNTERADAERELADAWEELQDAQRQIEDARQEIADGYRELDESEADARQELRDAEDTLNESLATLNDNEATYNESLSAYEDGVSQYNAGLSEYENSAALLALTGEQLNDAYGELETRQESFDALLSSVAAAVSSYVGAELDGEALLDALARGDEKITAVTGTVLASIPDSPVGTVAELLAADGALDEGWQEYYGGLAQYNDGMAQLAEAKAQLDSTAALLAESEAQLRSARAQLDDGWTQYYDGQRELEDGRRELEDSLESGRRELSDAEAELADAESEYSDGLRDYEDARAEADDQFADAERELADAEAELEDARQEIADIERPTVYVLSRWSNVGFACFDSDTDIVRNVAKVFPIFFFLIAALICVTTIKRMVDEQRSQLGVLMALGYGKGAIMSKFILYSGTATVLGCVIGVFLGSWLIPTVVWQAYKIMYYFSDTIIFTIDPVLSLGTFAAYLLAMLFVTWISCRKELSETPANIIRPKPPKNGKRVLLERVGFIWNRLSFMWKVSMRNIFRYRQRTLMMILGVAGCTALMITGFGIKNSISGVVDAQYEEITFYDLSVTFTDDMSADKQAEFTSGVGDRADGVLFLNQSAVTAVSGKKEKSVNLNVIGAGDADRVGDFISYHSSKGTELEYPQDGGALISTGLAESLELDVSDTFTVRTDEDALTLTVTGVFDNYVDNYVCVTADTYREQCGADAEVNTALVLAGEDADVGELSSYILGLDSVINVSENDAIRNRVNSMLTSLNYIVLLTIVCSAALAFTVIYNLTNINITERMREIATVKVLGFYDIESAAYVLRENIVMTIVGAALGVPLGIALNTFVMDQIKVDTIRFTPNIHGMSFVYSLMLTLLFSLLVDVFMYFRLNRINTAEALKAAE